MKRFFLSLALLIPISSQLHAGLQPQGPLVNLSSATFINETISTLTVINETVSSAVVTNETIAIATIVTAAISSGVLTNATIGTLIASSATISQNNVYLNGATVWTPVIFSSFSNVNVATVTILLPNTYDNLEITFTSSGTASESAAPSMFFNNDQTANYNTVTSTGFGLHVTNVGVSSITLSGATGGSFGYSMKASIGLNAQTVMKQGQFYGQILNTNVATAPKEFNGAFTYKAQAAITRVSICAYSTGAVAQQNLQAPMRLIIRAWNNPN